MSGKTDAQRITELEAHVVMLTAAVRVLGRVVGDSVPLGSMTTEQRKIMHEIAHL